MNKIVLIAAGGTGTRMKSDIPKQFLKLGKLPVLMHTINCFYRYDPSMEIRIILPEQQIAFWDVLCREYDFSLKCLVIAGGESRYHSIKNGLQGITPASLVAVHDGVRPLVSTGTITNCFDTAEKYGTAIPVIHVKESIRKMAGEDSVAEDRSQYRLVQTPQVFGSEILTDAYNLPYEEFFTDDASVVERAGYKIYLTEGNEENLKITTMTDLSIAESLMG